MSSTLRDPVVENRPPQIAYGNLGEFRDGWSPFVPGRAPSLQANRRVKHARHLHLRRWEDDGGMIISTTVGGES
jgi:hypothetical protein